MVHQLFPTVHQVYRWLERSIFGACLYIVVSLGLADWKREETPNATFMIVLFFLV